MTKHQLQAHINKYHGGSITAFAVAIGLTRQAIHLYLNDKRPIPKPVELACEALAMKINS